MEKENKNHTITKVGTLSAKVYFLKKKNHKKKHKGKEVAPFHLTKALCGQRLSSVVIGCLLPPTGEGTLFVKL